MCLAILQTPGRTIPADHLAEAWKTNSDGGGYMFFDETGGLTIRKFLSREAFIDSYLEDVARYPLSPFGVHLRLATHGSKDLDNVHPFRVDEHTAVLHNGILNVLMEKDKRSDTKTFVQDYLTQLPENWMDSEQLTDLVKDFCTGSKLVIMTNDPACQLNWYIINEASGHWDYNKDDPDDMGIWYSNKSYVKTHYSASKGKVKSFTYYKGDKDKDVDTVPAWWDDEYEWERATGGGVVPKSAEASASILLPTIVEDPDQAPTQDELWDAFADNDGVCISCDEREYDHDTLCFKCEWCGVHDVWMWTCYCSTTPEAEKAYCDWIDEQDEEDYRTFVMGKAEQKALPEMTTPV